MTRLRVRALAAAVAGWTALSCATRDVRPPEDPDRQAARILSDVSFIACDDLGGRDTPSAGLRVAARFIANRLQRLGWRPGAEGSWFHTYELIHRALDESACRAVAARGDEKLEFTYSSDYTFLPQQIADQDLTAGVVFLGKVPAALGSPGPDVRGKWVLFTEPGGNLQNVESELRAAGAAGVLSTINVMSNLGGDPEGGVVFKLFADLMREGRVSYPDKVPFLPRVYLKKRAIENLLTLAGIDKPSPGQALPIEFTERRRMRFDRKVECENVVGLWPGRTPGLSAPSIIVSAHYDHVGLDRRGSVCNGADDNGSGTCGLLALAEALAAHGRLDCPVLLVWLSGEEKGLWGSQALIESPWFEKGARPAANINLDMIGRNAGNQLLITPFDEKHPKHNGLARLARSIAASEGFTDVQSGDGYFERSDQANFAKLGIPVTFLTDGMHADYHEPTDDAEKIDGDKIRRVVNVVFKMLTTLEKDPAGLSK